ncbi:MAG: leucine-rich repeat protein [Candidatus Poribacteria bacterium]|nr:leucine-rich repeat protein [Candidatus Poribacteria bacterium]
MKPLSILSKAWKINAKNVIGALSLLLLILISPGTVEALQTALVRASDGKVYQIRFHIGAVNQDDYNVGDFVNDFSIYDQTGQVELCLATDEEVTWELYTAARILAETLRETPLFDDSALAEALNQAARDLGLDLLEAEVKELIISEIREIIDDSALEVLNFDLKVLDVSFHLPNPLTLIIEAVSFILKFANYELEYQRLFNAGARANRYAKTAIHLQELANQRAAELWDAINAGEVIENYSNPFLINGESVEISEDIGLYDPLHLRVVAQIYEKYAGYAVSVVTALGKDTDAYTIDDLSEAIINTGAKFVGTDALLGYLSTAEDAVREKKLLDLFNSRLVDEVTAVFSEKTNTVYNSAASDLDQYGFCKDTQHPSPKPVDPNPGENVANDPLLPNRSPEVYRQINPQNFTVGDDPKWRNLSSYFSDPDGDMLKYKATSSDDRIVVATIEDNSVKIKPGKAGTATVTVTAEDPGGLIAEQSFRVTVRMKLETIPSLPVCDRTPQVREEIMKRTGDSNCKNVTEDELESIRRLSLLEENISTLKQGDFDELRGLEELVLKGNFLETLPKDVFWYLGNLKELSLRNNQFIILVEDTFEHLDSLTYLSLRGNRLASLQQGAFNDLDALIELDLSDNKLMTLPTGVFEDLVNLEELDLENNDITTLSSGSFLGLSSLEDLYLDGNLLQTIKAGAFSGLDSLTRLKLDSAQLSTLQRDVFSGLSSLERLDLDENPLQTIEAGAFSGLDSLTHLDLYNTQLSTLQQDVFLGLSSLERLDLDESTLRVIEVGAFNGLSNLTALDLSENQLNTLPAGIFSGLSSLTSLNLRLNPGAPFTLTLELVRTDNTNLKVAGPATVKVKLAEGAPFDMNIRLSIEGGTLSADIVTLTRGQTESDPITVRQNGTRVATVKLEIAPTIPEGYRGIQMAVGSPLALFSDALPEEQVLIGDVNRDGTVNILDLVFVASKFGETNAADADLNGDGQVNIQDLVIVANNFSDVAAGPSPD